MSRYSCGLNGQCEFDPSGIYTSLGACNRSCRSVAQKDIHDLIFQYSPSEARMLAPSDQARIVKRLTTIQRDDGTVVFPGVDLGTEELSDALQALADSSSERLSALLTVSGLWPYLEQLYPRSAITEALYDQGSMLAYRRLLELIGPAQLDYNRLYRSALRNGYCDVADQLDALPQAYIELSNEEIMEYAEVPHDCTLQHILRVYRSFDGYYSEFFYAEGAAKHGDLELFLRLLRLYDGFKIMQYGALYGGLPFLERLALHNYYQTLSDAAMFGVPYVYLALENYQEDPADYELSEAMRYARDQETHDLLSSLLSTGIDCPDFSE